MDRRKLLGLSALLSLSLVTVDRETTKKIAQEVVRGEPLFFYPLPDTLKDAGNRDAQDLFAYADSQGVYIAGTIYVASPNQARVYATRFTNGAFREPELLDTLPREYVVAVPWPSEKEEVVVAQSNRILLYQKEGGWQKTPLATLPDGERVIHAVTTGQHLVVKSLAPDGQSAFLRVKGKGKEIALFDTTSADTFNAEVMESDNYDIALMSGIGTNGVYTLAYRLSDGKAEPMTPPPIAGVKVRGNSTILGVQTNDQFGGDIYGFIPINDGWQQVVHLPSTLLGGDYTSLIGITVENGLQRIYVKETNSSRTRTTLARYTPLTEGLIHREPLTQSMDVSPNKIVEMKSSPGQGTVIHASFAQSGAIFRGILHRGARAFFPCVLK